MSPFFSPFVINIICIFQVKIDLAVCLLSIKLKCVKWVFLYLTFRWRWPFYGISKHWHYRWKPQTLWTPVRQGWQFLASSPGRLSPRAPMSERCWHNLTWHHSERTSKLSPSNRTDVFHGNLHNDISSVYRQHSRCSSHCFSSTHLSSACCWQLFQKHFKMERQNCFRITWRTPAVWHK